MTTDEIIEYYAKLLVLQYAGKPKAAATVRALVGPVVMDQLPITVQNGFSIDTAIGVQLDILAKYVGVNRVSLTFTGQTTLSDDDLRTLIKLKVIQNNAGSSLATIQSELATFLSGAILVFDYQNMHMDYYFDSAFGSVTLAEVFVREGLLPKPMGVQLGALIYAPNITNFFGFRTYPLAAFNVTPANDYADYNLNRPWLSYANAISS